MIDIDLPADLNAEDDDGQGWSLLREALRPAEVRKGDYLVAGNAQAVAVVRVVGIDEDGQVHFVILPGPVSKNSHLLRRTVA
jgi:hypothetical protein